MKKLALLAASLALCALFALEPPLSATAAESPPATYSYARGRTGSDNDSDTGYTSVYAADVLTQMGYSLGEVERAYLSEYADFLLTYTPSITSTRIKTAFDGDTVTVTAEPDSYLATNNKTVSWTPVSVDGTPMTAEGDSYVWSKSGVTEEDGDTVNVTYETNSLVIAGQDVNAFLNLTYNAAVAADAKVEQAKKEYEEALAAYNRAVREYEDYLVAMEVYRAEYEAYVINQAALKSWEERNAAYQDYLKKYAEYLATLEKYESIEKQWRDYDAAMLRYEAYLKEKAEYDAKLKAYNDAMNSNEVKRAEYQISVLDYIFTPHTSLERSLSMAILSESVLQVLAQLDAILSEVSIIGIERNSILLAQQATLTLRPVLYQYSMLKTKDEKFEFYCSARDVLSNNFNILLRCLDYLYNYFSEVSSQIKKMERAEQFEIMLAQLFYVCNALDDDPVLNYFNVHTTKNPENKKYNFDSTYTIGPNRRKPAAILGSAGVLEDKNWGKPLTRWYPDVPEHPGTAPAVVTKPTQPPARIEMPKEPNRVQSPGERPNELPLPVEPEEKPVPGTPPVAYVPTAEEEALIGALKGGLTARTPLTSDHVYTARVTVHKFFRNAQELAVYFYISEDAESYEYMIPEAEVGSSVRYVGATPRKAETVAETYTFDGWATKEDPDTLVDLNNLPSASGSELHLYPHFAATPCYYSVVWVVNGKTDTTEWAYGTYPVYDGILELVKENDSDGRQYRFTGWDKPFEPMTEKGARYTAVFEPSYLVTWVWEPVRGKGTTTKESYWKEETPVYKGSLEPFTDATTRYTFDGWTIGNPNSNTGDVTYTAKFIKEDLFTVGSTKVSVTLEDGVYFVDCSKLSQREYTIGTILEIAVAEYRGLAIAFSAGKVTLGYEAAKAAKESGVTSLAVTCSIVSGKSSFKVCAYDANGAELFPANCTIEFTATSKNFNSAIDYLYEIAPESALAVRAATPYAAGRSRIDYTPVEGGLKFDLKPGYDYELISLYSVRMVPNDYGATISVATAYEEGSPYNASVTFTVNIPATEENRYLQIASVALYDEAGNTVNVTESKGTYSFTMPRSDVRVEVAFKFDIPQYSVVFLWEDGEVYQSKIYQLDEAIVLPAGPRKVEDEEYRYTFRGWESSADGNVYEAGETYVVTGEVTFTARYTRTKIVRYTVAFYLEKDGYCFLLREYEAGVTSIEWPSITPYKEPDDEYKYTFIGWKIEGVDTLYQAGDTFIVTSDVAFIAEFEKTPIETPPQGEYTVRFVSEDGYLYDSERYDSGTVITMPAAPEKPDDGTHAYAFLGWLCDYDGKTYQVGDSFTMPDADVRFTALFEKTEIVYYTVRFVSEGRDFFQSKKYKVGSTAIEWPEDVPEKPDDDVYRYTFLGWKIEGRDRLYQAGDAFTVTGDVVFTAVFEAKELVVDPPEVESYTVRFFSDGEEVFKPAQYPVGTTEIKWPTTPQKYDPEGKYSYVFLGWRSSADGKLYKADDAFTMPDSDVTFTAEFEQREILTPDPGPVDPGVAKLLMLIRIAKIVLPIVAVLLVGAIVLTVLLILKKRRKKGVAQSANGTGSEGAAPENGATMSEGAPSEPDGNPPAETENGGNDSPAE